MSIEQAASQVAASAAEAAPSVPTSFDLRNVGGKSYITPVKDQKTCGSCVAFGSVAAIEGSIAWTKKTPSPSIDLSEAQLFYCFGAKDGARCETGWWPERALPFCQSSGLVDDPCFPYTPGNQPCNLCKDWEKRLTKISGFSVLTGQAAMKQWIYAKGAIVGCFVVFEDFITYRSGVYKHVSGGQLGGHCISIVGYDDSSRCWICKNSWDTSWGDQGYFRIEYGQCGIDSWDVIGVTA